MGQVEAVMTENITSYWDAVHAEILGILKAFEFAREVRITHFELEGDAQSVIYRINNLQEDLSMTGHVIKDKAIFGF